MPYILYTAFDPKPLSVSEQNRLEHRLGRRLLIRGLAELYSVSADEDRIGDMLSVPDSGKPYLSGYPEIRFNITHCAGLAACAFDSEEVGVDAEMPGYFPEILIKRALSPAEKQLLSERGITEDLRNEWFYRLWTLKEAYVKRSGIGVDTDLTAFGFSFSENETSPSVTCTDPGVRCFQTALPTGHLLSLCYAKNREEPQILPCSL